VAKEKSETFEHFMEASAAHGGDPKVALAAELLSLFAGEEEGGGGRLAEARSLWAQANM
jgi:hypothetical protein